MATKPKNEITVLRWEYPDHQGPYISPRWANEGDSSPLRKAVEHLKRMCYRHNRCHAHPSPYNDGPGLEIYNRICGFKNKTQMSRWFTPWNQAAMKAVGLSLVAYRVAPEHVSIGEKQVTFNPVYAKRIPI